jgi:hypothetical protein
MCENTNSKVKKKKISEEKKMSMKNEEKINVNYTAKFS